MSPKFTKEVEKIIDQISLSVLDQEKVISLLICALIAQENIALIGLPGEAKTMISSVFAEYMFNKKPGYHLLNRYTTPDDVFGMLSIKELTENDIMKRRHKFNNDKIIIFDEIFKANAACLNSLLGLLNERIVEDEKYNQEMVIGLSNETPQSDEGNDISPLWDRFLIRQIVSPLNTNTRKGMESLLKIMRGDIQEKSKNDFDFNVIEDLRKKSEKIRNKISMDIALKFVSIKHDLKVININISTRRMSKAAKIISAFAAMQGKEEVDGYDLEILKSVFWDQRKDIEKVCQVIDNHIPDPLAEFKELVSSITRDSRYAYEERDTVKKGEMLAGVSRLIAIADGFINSEKEMDLKVRMVNILQESKQNFDSIRKNYIRSLR
jgi:MoxR-like ATPase